MSDNTSRVVQTNKAVAAQRIETTKQQLLALTPYIDIRRRLMAEYSISERHAERLIARARDEITRQYKEETTVLMAGLRERARLLYDEIEDKQIDTKGETAKDREILRLTRIRDRVKLIDTCSRLVPQQERQPANALQVNIFNTVPNPTITEAFRSKET